MVSVTMLQLSRRFATNGSFRGFKTLISLRKTAWVAAREDMERHAGVTFQRRFLGLSDVLQNMKKTQKGQFIISYAVIMYDLTFHHAIFNIGKKRSKKKPKADSPLSEGGDGAEGKSLKGKNSNSKGNIRKGAAKGTGDAPLQELSSFQKAIKAQLDGTMNAEAIRGDVVQGMSSLLETGTAKVHTQDVTEGELRYQRYLARMEDKRDKLNRQYTPEGRDQGKGSRRRKSSGSEGSAPHVNVSNIKPVSNVRGKNDGSGDSAVAAAASGGTMELSALRARVLAQQQENQQHSSAPRSDKGSTRKTKTKHNDSSRLDERTVAIPHGGIALRDLAAALGVPMKALRVQIEDAGESLEATNEGSGGSDADLIVGPDTAELVALENGANAERLEDRDKGAQALARRRRGNKSREEGLTSFPRAPVVCIMGHVDHGKTTLLDTLRLASVADGEAGGITQKLSAFSVVPQNRDKEIIFLDTPGHAAFTAMRSFGAHATDIVVLVVAIDDGVRPQTRESIRIAREAGCTVVVAVNKVDKIKSESDRTEARLSLLSELTKEDLIVEEFGGDIQVVDISGKTGMGMEELLDTIQLQAEMLELSAFDDGLAEGTVLDSHIEKGRGTVIDVLVQTGKLKLGDPIVVGSAFGKVKALLDSQGTTITEAVAPMPVRVLGLRSLPDAGLTQGKMGTLELLAVETEGAARVIAERRARVVSLQRLKAQEETARNAAADEARMLASSAENDGDGLEAVDEAGVGVHASGATLGTAEAEMIRLVLKADGQGTLQALRKIVDGICEEAGSDVNINIVSEGVGDVNQNDISILSHNPSAVSGRNMVLGFNVKIADPSTKSAAKQADVYASVDSVVYRLEDSLCSATNALMPRKEVLTRVGGATCLKTFQLNDKQKSMVAGLSVRDGTLRAGPGFIFRVKRGDGFVLPRSGGTRVTLRRFKDTVEEVQSGSECGLSISRHRDFQEGDEIECLEIGYDSRVISATEKR